MPEKLLYLLRHAKSSWDDPKLPDHDRPLNPRGLKAAKRMAQRMHRANVSPALLLCSSARRARETLAPVEQALSPAKIKVEEGLYAADAAQLLERLHRIAPSVQSVMIIGHNPGIQELAVQLMGDQEARSRMASKFPAGSLATLSIRAPRWRELAAGGVELVEFMMPRDA
ncbi:MAG: histidine phosphatase family protein [Candidatus Dormibacteraeota bacterium]|nr:histidine phosphatase family protein [Candidatus Dormibacteraeota bacterium]